MHCQEVREQMAAYAGRALDAAAARAVEAHVADCADCTRELSETEAAWQALEALPEPAVPSGRMRERFAAALAAEQASLERRPASADFPRRWRLAGWPGEPLVQTAMAASILAAGVLIGRTLPSRSPQPPAPASSELSDVRSELRDMRQMLTLSLLQQQSATERLRGVSWTARIDQPGNEIVGALLDTLLHDPNVNVRLAAVDALRRVSDRADVRAGTQRAAGDRNAPLLQVAVIDFMVETRDPQALALLRTLAQDESLDDAVRGRARWGLEQLS